MHRASSSVKATLRLSSRHNSATMAPTRSVHSSSKVSSETKGGALYKHQDSLPYLPIPSLASTAQKFLDSARPFVSDPSPQAMVAGEDNPTKEYERLKKAVKEFETSAYTKELQKRLEEHAKGKDSWLIDWFNSANYFGRSSRLALPAPT